MLVVDSDVRDRLAIKCTACGHHVDNHSMEACAYKEDGRKCVCTLARDEVRSVWEGRFDAIRH